MDKIIQENRIRKEMGLISIEEGAPKSSEKREAPEKREKTSPVADNKNV